jgi:hypothetical protein
MNWQKLLKIPVSQLEAGGLPNNSWTFGGGTALMTILNHRLSKDIDIFLSDPQLLTLLSPRLNDACGESIEYIE